MGNANGMSIFYQLMTGVFGPSGLPYAVATTGWEMADNINPIEWYAFWNAVLGITAYFCWRGLQRGLKFPSPKETAYVATNGNVYTTTYIQPADVTRPTQPAPVDMGIL
ncbi:hypothetical protein SVAN01_09362 [Stagonosporopsis vannaccii]|nr:hypothetical protein SVAN01_09362 [Stagonosporopsis vannaccii]